MSIKFKNIFFLVLALILMGFFIFLMINLPSKNQSSKKNEDIIVNNIDSNLDSSSLNIGIINGGYEGIYIYDLSKKEIVKNINTGNYVNKAELDGNYIYLVDKEGLKIYSVNNSFEVELLNSFNTYGDSLSLVKNGDYIYLADGNNGIVVFELDKNIYIRFLQHIRINGIVIELVKKDDYIFTLGPRFGLKIFEIQENKLKEISSYASLISPSKIYIHDNTLFIKDDFLGLYTYNISSILKNNNFSPEKKYNFQIGDIAAISEDKFYFTNSRGLNLYENDKSTLIYEDNLLRSSIKINENEVYISKKEKGFKIYDLNKNKIIFDHNILSYVNNINVFKNGIFIEDSNVIHFFDKDFNLKWSKEIEGTVTKTQDGMISYKDNSVTLIKEKEVITKQYEYPINKVIDNHENILVITDESILSFQEGNAILEGNYIDFLKYNNEFFVADKNNIYIFDPLSKELNKIFYSSNEIYSIEKNSEYLFILTDYGIQFLDNNYEPIKHFSYSSYPDNYIFKDDLFYMTIQDTFLILNSRIDNMYYEHDFKVPLVDIDVFNDQIYLSHSSYGIEWFELNKNLELILEGEFLIFNANNFYL
ncbi:MAG: hypothetical protein ACQESN_01715 [Thermotogota bacterium]